MAASTKPFSRTTTASRTLTGGKHRPRPNAFERYDSANTSSTGGSDMPLETDVHWTWRNPLNIIIPVFLLVFFLLGIGLTALLG
jgi:hypothetical protein